MRIRPLVGTFVAALVLATGCTPPPGGGGPALDQCPTQGAGQVRVAVVVDASELGGSLSVVCVVVPAGSNGVTALAARAARVGQGDPRYDLSGLLCAIDGAPAAPACGDLGPNGFEYWSYWTGGSSWQFAPVGPANRTMTDGTVEGWRFTPGGTAQPPATVSAGFDDLVS